MKNIAIITITRNANHGNVLQNFALQTVLRGMGCRPETVRNLTESELFSDAARGWKETVKRLLNYHGFRSREKRSRIFRNFCERYIAYSPVTYREGRFSGALEADGYLTGSDQVWNPSFGLATDYELLRFAPRDRKFSYAASFGVADLQGVSPEKRESILQGLGDFREISVREESGQRIVEQLTQVPAAVHPDPTMLLTGDTWQCYCQKPDMRVPERYVFVYLLGETSAAHRQAIRDCTKACRAKAVDGMKGKGQSLHPFQFLWMIRYARCVCTDSFHAAVFAILFHRPFRIVSRIDRFADQSSRFSTLLRVCGIQREAACAGIFGDAADWDAIDRRIADERTAALAYLKRQVDAAPGAPEA